MSKGSQTFGDYLLQFSLIIDIVDSTTFNKFADIIEEYVKSDLKLDSLSLKNKTVIDGNVGLQIVSGQNKGTNFTVLRDGEITGQSAYAFIKKVPIWVVNTEKKELRDLESHHVDLWSQVDELPQNKEQKEQKRPGVKTSIFVPVVRDNEAVGVVEFEIMQYIEPTSAIKDELVKIADSISRVRYLYRSFEARNKNTQDAIKSLRRYLRIANQPDLKKPKVFVAFPKLAEETVTGSIKSVLDSFSDRIHITFWDECSESGKVDQQIIKAVSESKFGVCYFSEPTPAGAAYKYIDNSNVIFEAGMFQSMTNSPREKPIGWLPIRENDSPPIPFDFGSERILMVERLNDHSLNQQAFAASLKERISALLQKD